MTTQSGGGPERPRQTSRPSRPSQLGPEEAAPQPRSRGPRRAGVWRSALERSDAGVGSAILSGAKPQLDPRSPLGRRTSADAAAAAAGRIDALPAALGRSAAADRILDEALAAEAAPRRAGAAMPKRVAGEPGFILHSRPWSESSLLLDALTPRYGRVFLVAKGAKRPSSNLRGLLSAFSPVKLTWTGRAEAKILVKAEWMGTFLPLDGEALLSGFYMNELVLRMTEREDPTPGLFTAYAEGLSGLALGADAGERQAALRRFECALLRLSGWPLALEHADGAAAFYVRDGLLEGIPEGAAAPEGAALYPREAALAAVEEDFSTPAKRRAARDILREVIQHRLGARTLRTRRVLAELNQLGRA